MQNKQAVLQFLGLAQKAGKLVSGTELALQTTPQLFFVARDASAATSEAVARAAQAKGVKLNQNFTSAELSQAIGRQRKVVAVMDQGFAKALIKKIKQGEWFDG